MADTLAALHRLVAVGVGRDAEEVHANGHANRALALLLLQRRRQSAQTASRS